MKIQLLLGLLNPIIALIFSLTFLIFWTRDRDKNFSLLISVSFFLLGSGFLISHLIPQELALLNITSTNTLFMVGAVTLILAVTERANNKAAWQQLSVVGISGVLIAFVLQYLLPTVNLTLLVINFAVGIIFGIGTLHLHARAKHGGIEKVLFWLFLVVTIQFFVRPTVSLAIEGPIFPAQYRQSYYWVVLNFTGALSSVVNAMVLIAVYTSDLIAQIKAVSETDHLTGIKTRKAFVENCRETMDHADKSPLPLTMIISDIDHFKNINDAFGHPCGDAVISAFGTILKSASRQGDVIGRVGGDEFCVVLWNTDQVVAKLFAENIRTAFNPKIIDSLPNDLSVSASFGIATYEQGEDLDQWYARADAVLYKAKKSGRNCVQLDEVKTRNSFDSLDIS